MFEEFYRLTGHPFKLSPDSRFFFGSSGHQKAMAYLQYGVQQGEGFIVITGDVGAGKSTLVEQLFSTLDRNRVLAAHIATTQVAPEDAVRLILNAFKSEVRTNDKASLLQAFESFLLTQHRARRRVLLVVDEAQNLPLRTIEELRMLSNFAVAGQSLFQCFLLGQPQFRDTLAHPDMMQLRQRVIASYHLGPLSPEETEAYVRHRLERVGWAGDPSLTEAAFGALYRGSGGVPRRINTLTGRLLLFGAVEGRHTLDGPDVETVLADLAEEVAEQPVVAGRAPAPLADTESLFASTVPAARAMAQQAADAAQAASLAASLALPRPASADPALVSRIERLERTLQEQGAALRSLMETACALLGGAATLGQPAARVSAEGEGE